MTLGKTEEKGEPGGVYQNAAGLVCCWKKWRLKGRETAHFFVRKGV